MKFRTHFTYFIQVISLSGLFLVRSSSQEVFGNVSSRGLFDIRDTDDDDVCPPACFTLDGALNPLKGPGNQKRTFSTSRYRHGNSSDVDADGDDWDYVRRHDKRVLRPQLGSIQAITVGDIDRFMKASTSNDPPNFTNFIWKDPRGNDQSTAVLKKFSRSEFSIGLDWMHGCTSVCVVTRYGVWCAHYWETLAFCYKNGNLLPPKQFELNAYNNIVGTGDTLVAGPSLESVKGTLIPNLNDANNFIGVFVMTPQRVTGKNNVPSGQGQLQFTQRVNTLIRGIKDTIPQVQTSDVQVYDYVPVNVQPPKNPNDVPTDPELDDTARGRILVQYDPDSNGQRQPGVRLIFERALPGSGVLFERVW